MAERVDDTDKVVFEKLNRDNSFGLGGHSMEVLKIESEDDLYGIDKVKEGRQTAFVPILDVEIKDDNSMNKKYFDEYAEWFLN